MLFPKASPVRFPTYPCETVAHLRLSVESILETREKILSSLDQVALNEMEKYRAQRLLGTHVCKAVETTGPKNSVTVPQKKAHCDTVAVGAIMRSMFLAGMWPPQQTTQSRTVTKTAHGLTMIEDFGNEIPEPGYMNTKVLHTNCGPQADLKRGVSGVLAGVKGLKLSDIRPKGTVLIPEKWSVTTTVNNSFDQSANVSGAVNNPVVGGGCDLESGDCNVVQCIRTIKDG